MKNKNLKILGVIFLIFAGLVVWQIYSPQLLPESSPYFNSMKSINKDSINTVSISSKTGSVTLQKEKGGWLVNGKKADSSKVGELFDSLFPVNSPDLVTRNDKRFAEFELTGNLATKISLDKKKTIFLGKVSYPNIYARIDGQNEVFLLKSPPINLTNPGDWVENTKNSYK